MWIFRSRLHRAPLFTFALVRCANQADKIKKFPRAWNFHLKHRGNTHRKLHYLLWELPSHFKNNRYFYASAENKSTTAPNMTRIIPVALFRVFGSALFANTAATLAQKRVNTIQEIQTNRSGLPPMAKWETAPVSAVKVMIKTLVPTAVFNSYPRTDVSIKSIIIPPPAPTNPQINPIRTPQRMDWIALFFAETSIMASFVVITGFTINFIPSNKVINTETFPIAVDGTKLET